MSGDDATDVPPGKPGDCRHQAREPGPPSVSGRPRSVRIGLVPWLALFAACGPAGPTRERVDAHYVQPLPDAGDPGDAGGEPPRCPPSRSPEREFANTLIRGTAPDDALPGNSWEALLHAAELGWPYVEVDVRITVDERLVPTRHDDLSAFTDCAGSLATTRADDLVDCTYLDSGVPVRPIDDGLDGSGFRGVFLDLKSTLDAPRSTPEEVVDAVQALVDVAEDPESIVAMSYDLDVAAALLDAELRTALKGYPDEGGDARPLLHDAEAIGAEMICVELSFQDEAFYAEAMGSDVWLLPWAHVEDVDAASMRALMDAGGGGLISSIPDEVADLVRAICLP